MECKPKREISRFLEDAVTAHKVLLRRYDRYGCFIQ